MIDTLTTQQRTRHREIEPMKTSQKDREISKSSERAVCL